MLLNELFDSALDYKQIDVNQKFNTAYKFNTDNGENGIVRFKQKTYDVLEAMLISYVVRQVFTNEEREKYQNHIIKTNDLLKLAIRKLPLPIEEEFEIGGSFDITGKGEQYQIFSTVVAITKEYITKNNPDIMFMAAEEPSRIKLYNRMFKMFPNKTIILDKDGYKVFLVVNNKTASIISDMIKDAKRLLSSK